jgi:hypothetical protein
LSKSERGHLRRLTPIRRHASLLAGVCLAVLLALALPLYAQRVAAQAQPPNRYYGTVTINGQDQPEGTVVEAYIGNTLCGSGTVDTRNGSKIYLVDVLGAGQKPNCAKDGDKVTFKIAGLDAKETGTYDTAAATHLDLTASGTARNPAQPTVLAPGAGGTPAPPPPIPTSPVGTSTPPPGVTETPEESPAAGAATETPSPEASATATLTATASATVPAVTNGNTATTTSSRSPLGVVLVLAILAIAAGAGALMYQRRPRP